MKDCGKKCAKYLLFAFNIFVWIAGAAVLGVGIYLRVNDDIEAVFTVANLTFYYSGCYVLIAAGGTMFVIGFFGCCGAVSENRCLLGLYSVVLAIILIAEVTIGIWAAVNHGSIEDDIQQAFNTTLKNGNDTSDPFVQSILSVEKRFECCGLTDGCTDWEKNLPYGCECDPKTAANGTCVMAELQGCSTANGPYVWKEACYDSVVEFVEDHFWVIVGIGVGIGLAEIFGIIFSICVCRLSQKHTYDSMYA